ncbi:hypothetical protein [Pseudobutyrivibrio xylanivorans]|uniref:Uncharacterized protein n=1 Tax=Pseudobutyrivibrio xylanivorans DSM 14809 TaxID=1123012 RepID=A0A1M6C952_PSEXY|nr:hypothetical protein [Pseudobutyrivibrio xylanivorans]SHI57288.1 hypothetical protein SAMN02745725_00629 [Pseudobutyrivibrio xylanivorans DSM 14809]
MSKNIMKSYDIREIERIIDDYHKNHPALTGTKEQIRYELLATYGDLCVINFKAMMLNPFAMGKITDYMDALNQALMWINQASLDDTDENLSFELSERRYKLLYSFLDKYAYPYSVICSGYISYSRKRFTADVKRKKVIFNLSKENDTAWNDMLRERMNTGDNNFLELFNPVKISVALQNLREHVHVDNGQLWYEINHDILEPFLEIACNQWDATKTLPEYWQFDLFSLEEYRQTWIDIAALCYIHFGSLFTIKDPKVRWENSIIRITKEDLVSLIASINGLKRKVVENIVEYLIYDYKIKNMDVMYQPIIALRKQGLLIAPMLFIGANPERNLLSLVSLKNKDYEHSKEVNNLENLMVEKIQSVLSKNYFIVKHKRLGGRLPDIDLGIYDKESNVILLCELKWFMAADSSKEIFAREDDITHGCEQQEMVIEYATKDKLDFIKKVFGESTEQDVDIIACVVAKNNIRTQNDNIPVIDELTLINLLSKKSLGEVCSIIKNHKYELDMPDNCLKTHKKVRYAGFTFEIPALCIGDK